MGGIILGSNVARSSGMQKNSSENKQKKDLQKDTRFKAISEMKFFLSLYIIRFEIFQVKIN